MHAGEKSKIRKRHFAVNEETLKENPSLICYGASSLNARQDMLIKEVPKLGAEAATKAIKEWGRPISEITHVIFYTTSGLDMPGADFQLCKLLGLNSVNRLMMYNLGCYAGGTVLRVAKDIAENNAGARILAVCSENLGISFHAPCTTRMDLLVGHALFGDGAAALIIGSDPDLETESSLFQIVHASQKTIPDTEDAIQGHLREMGLDYYLSPNIPMLISNHVEKCLIEVMSSSGIGNHIKDFNSLFYAIHAGGPAILDKIEDKLGLENEKLKASRHILSEYGNVLSVSLLQILDEIKKTLQQRQSNPTGQLLDWGVAMGIGPGLSVEVVILRCQITN